MRPRIVVICTLLREHPYPRSAGRREFCADCRSRVWLSETSIDACRAEDARALAVCAPCARVRLAGDEEAEFLETSAASVREAAEALGVSEAEARRIGERWVDEWRAGRRP